MEGFGVALTLPTSTSLVIMTMLKQFSCHTILQKSYSVSSIGPARVGGRGEQESKNMKAMRHCETVHSSDLPHLGGVLISKDAALNKASENAAQQENNNPGGGGGGGGGEREKKDTTDAGLGGGEGGEGSEGISVEVHPPPPSPPPPPHPRVGNSFLHICSQSAASWLPELVWGSRGFQP